MRGRKGALQTVLKPEVGMSGAAVTRSCEQSHAVVPTSLQSPLAVSRAAEKVESNRTYDSKNTLTVAAGL